MALIVGLVEKKTVRAVVGRVVDFADVPAAITAMADRATTGRTVVMVDRSAP
ncbi:MAG: hypothetical protein ACRDY1_09930 [Acidimicrobiales bacterium]